MLEYFNEGILLLCSYMLPSFTGYIPDLEGNYKFGWILCWILVPFFLVNISFLATVAI